MRGNLADRFAQAIGGKASQIEKAVRPALVRQNPAEGGKGQCRSILYVIFTCVKNGWQSVNKYKCLVVPPSGRRGSGAK
ncbi:hypothetical protein GCM10023208_02580 [Erythrobacter westpacificensis]|uniref:Uncharacterized protein n=1 Tax=Erythrobacter westpacificensis TaxID=1055231 RepID=A0ABP9K098_9SPHN